VGVCGCVCVWVGVCEAYTLEAELSSIINGCTCCYQHHDGKEVGCNSNDHHFSNFLFCPHFFPLFKVSQLLLCVCALGVGVGI